MNLQGAYLGVAAQAVTLLGEREVAASWEKPSALAEMTVGGLAGHLMHQIFSASAVLQEPASAEAPIPLLEHYARAVWVDEPLDGEVNTGIRARGEQIASEGAQPLLEQARAALAELQAELPAMPGDAAVFIPWGGWALTLNDFLVTRMMELAVHMDDLAVSVGITTPEIAGAAFEPVLSLLTHLSVRRHGQAALLRALSRVERAPSAINAL
ncbi:maleylpyruvate isomerase N-terminal domain-containing protein [Streptomyces sp. NPDC059717]|uniref:maleylpyruvate isomerase N-terminal domain-containing protein n=1 Tax=Streptomyces sp. NPDC059717 TaxID=3346922 RepID=UPI0036BBDCF2